MLRGLVILLLLLSSAAAATDRVPTRIGDMQDFQSLLAPRSERVDGLIPHGRVARHGGLAAWYAGPTRRYRNGVLGDRIESERLVVAAEGQRFTFVLPKTSVFEDLEPRIVDADGDGKPEILTVKSYLSTGATIALFGLRGGALVALAEAPAIGFAGRWLNPAGVADYDGDGEVEIAVVESPHLGGQLVLYRWDGGDRIREERRGPGYSTHHLGSTVLAMSRTLDWNRDGVPDLMMPRQNRADLAVVTTVEGRRRELARYRHPAEIVTSLVETDLEGDGRAEIVYGLRDGSVWSLAVD